MLTGIAVVLGVAFMAGTFVLTDTIKKSYDDIAANVYSDTDAVVRSAHVIEGSNREPTPRHRSTHRCSTTVRAVPGVQAAEPQQLGIAVVVGHDGELLDANRNRSVPIALAWQDTTGAQPDGARRRSRARARRTRSSSTEHRPTRVTSRSARTCSVISQVGSARVPHRRHRDVRRRTTARPVRRSSRSRRDDRVRGDRHARSLRRDPGRRRSGRLAGAARRPACRRRCHDPEVEVITGAQATEEARTGDRDVAAVREHVPDDVRHRGTRRRLVRDLQHLLDHRRAAHQGDSAVAGDRRQAPAGACARCASRRSFIGVFASAVGVVAGIGTGARARARCSTAFGVDLPAGGTVVEPAHDRGLDAHRHRRDLRRGMAAGSPGRQGRADRGAA